MTARTVTTNQQDIHTDLLTEVYKHQHHPFRKPPAEHTVAAFQEVSALLADWQGPVMLDACCGVGESTHRLAGQYPDALILGIDKSAHRLQRHVHYVKGDTQSGQVMLLRADLNDFWRLAQAAGWHFSRQFIFYPNPWPKSKHLSRRWHGAPVFPAIVATGGQLTVRSNWSLYVNELAAALSCYGVDAQVSPLAPGLSPMTPFERKYQHSGQLLWQLQADLDTADQERLAAPADVVLKFAAQPNNSGAGDNSGA